ncbi:MAG: hypothetical protein CMP20_01885 [Rickettsiales bacterium]|nr:hypothetical protein [Rickettsiales bacterium]
MDGLSEAQKLSILYLFGQQKLVTTSPLGNVAKQILESSNAAQTVYVMLPKDYYSMVDYIAEMIRGGVVDDETTANLVCLGKDILEGPGSSPLTWAALDTEANKTFKMCRSFGMTTKEQNATFDERE